MPGKLSIRGIKNKFRTGNEPPIDQAIQDVAAAIEAREKDFLRQEQLRQQREQDTYNRRQREEQDDQMRRENDRMQEERRIQEEARRRSDVEAENRRVAEEKQRLMKQQNSSAETIARLRSLIRERYRLDVWIWNNRNTPEANRYIIFEECKKADEILVQIYNIVNAWEASDFNEQEREEWRIAEVIKKTVMRPDEHVMWCKTPPWECSEEGSVRVRRV